MVRFLLDHHVPKAIYSGLLKLNIEVVTAEQQGIDQDSDESILEYARTHDYVVFTQDTDFLTLSASGIPHAGIIYCRQRTRTISQVIDFLKLVNECYDAADMRDRIEYA